MPPHELVGEVRPLRLEAWPRWCRKGEAADAVVMPALQVAPLLDENALAVVEVSDDMLKQ